MDTNKIEIKQCCKERFAPVLTEIDRLLGEGEDTILIAIDGKCASGKTTLGSYLKEIYDCNLFHMDDFFLQSHQRTDKRLAEIGGNVDYERFHEEVIIPIEHKETVNYRPFSCCVGQIQDGVMIPFKRLNIIEGSYSLHPYFRNAYALKVFLDIKEAEQIHNIRKRNGEDMLTRFIEEWIPKENIYFNTFHISEGCYIINW